ncbi:hypothetical protein HBI81_066770 [Parastagonospora nodorum]|nr:hypothetical protein HBH43_240940 [Parastagonospora nodorum]KAH5210070.1 hypothetical protein HBH68_074390 [Parastagonospora nodorum]KAH5400378.1 hypothetical protein HBI47_197830 [Parastagonospora nodorum]KAH5588452.1 hypothetical protein HBI45_224570 [Parastagonospora nodorum]KAH6196642.1 hypothetical protein HBI15_213380 [Parastagonospora nodorum]
MSYLLKIPVEIQVCVADACSTVDLKRLCETCRVLRERLLPELYRTIDLSSHNVDEVCEPWGKDAGDNEVPPTFSERYWEYFDKDVSWRQKKFVETMQRKPMYARHVRTLHWTVFETTLSYWGRPEKPDSDKETDEEDEDAPLYVPEDEPLWKIFQSFTNITHVDLCWVRAWREVTLPAYLFPSATSIRLSGCMSRELVACILRPQLQSNSNLTHLELNDVSQWAETTPPLPTFSHLRESQTYFRDHFHDHTPVYDSRQMIDALDPLIDRCPYLTSLRIAILGPCEEHGPDSREERLYRSCARFISSVRKTLRNLNFEQGYSFNEQTGWDRPWNRREKIFPRPMDRIFARFILPVLLEAPWPCMEKMELRGVGEYTREYTRRYPVPADTDDVEYTDRRESFPINGKRRNTHWTFNITVKSFPSATQMQLDLQALIPQATILVEEEVEQDFESFIEESYGIDDDSKWRTCG